MGPNSKLCIAGLPHIPYKGREQLQNPAISGEILGENHALKTDTQKKIKKEQPEYRYQYWLYRLCLL
jgi:hypothetical protein